MNLLEFLKGITNEEKGTGALLDTRPPEERLKDFRFEEAVAAAAPVVWKEKKQSEWRKFPIFDQNGSGSCVAQTMAKLLGILYFLKEGNYVHFSATHIYQRRNNKPSSGMSGVNAFDIAQTGVTLEILVPSQDMNDREMDEVVVEPYEQAVGSVFKLGNYLIIPTKDIDTIASTIEQTKKGVMVWFYFSSGLSPKEWMQVPEIKHPNLPISGSKTARHSVTAVDYTLYKGKKALIIEDSWGLEHGFSGQRVITEDFFKARNFFAAYPINFTFASETTPVTPHFDFQRDLQFSPTVVYDQEVAKLQDMLKYEGFFPSNIESTGYYGSITAQAVLKWQIRHQVAPLAELESLAGRYFGKQSRRKANELYQS